MTAVQKRKPAKPPDPPEQPPVADEPKRARSKEYSEPQADGTVYCVPGGEMHPALLAACIEADQPKPRAFTPKPCVCCRALREVGTNYSRVYAVRHDGPTLVRYIRCSFCGNTWKES